MGTAVLVVVVIIGVLAVGLLRDSIRTSAVNRWAKVHGFTFVPQAELDRDRLGAWAALFRPHNASQWGIVLRGSTGGMETTIAEHKEKPRGSPERWHTLVVTRVPGARFDGVRLTHAPSQTLRSVTDAIVAPGREIRTALGIEITAPPAVYVVGKGRWAVETATEDALRFWSSAPQAAAIDAWPHDVELAAIDDFVLVRTTEVITAQRLDDLLVVGDAARAFFVEAAARMRVGATGGQPAASA